VFLEVLVPPLGRRIPRISTSSSYKGIPPNNKRKSVVKESIVVSKPTPKPE